MCGMHANLECSDALLVIDTSGKAYAGAALLCKVEYLAAGCEAGEDRLHVVGTVEAVHAGLELPCPVSARVLDVDHVHRTRVVRRGDARLVLGGERLGCSPRRARRQDAAVVHCPHQQELHVYSVHEVHAFAHMKSGFGGASETRGEVAT